MKFTSDDRPGRPLRAAGNRCVWMEAGILSYLLCDREFNCDHCPLDEAMRSHYSPAAKDRGGARVRRADGAEERKADPHPPRAGADSDAGALFTPGHLIVSPVGQGRYRVALEDGLAEVLPPVKSVVLPRPGDPLTAGAFCAWLVLDGGTLPVALPAAGTVDSVNPRLIDEPHLVNGAPAGDAWLFCFTPADRGALRSAFLDRRDAGSKFLADQDAFRRLALECLDPPGAGAGMTFHDGGRLVDDLAAMIGPVKYVEIVRRVFGAGR